MNKLAKASGLFAILALAAFFNGMPVLGGFCIWFLLIFGICALISMNRVLKIHAQERGESVTGFDNLS